MALIWCPLTGIPAMLVILLTPFLGLSKCQRLCWRCSTIFFKIVLWSSGCAYTVEGLEQLDPEGNYFFACNHESLWDVPLVFAALPFWLISIAKKSLRLVPVFGWAVAAGGTVWIDRKNHAADMKSMQVAEESLRKRPRSRLFPTPSPVLVHVLLPIARRLACSLAPERARRDADMLIYFQLILADQSCRTAMGQHVFVHGERARARERQGQRQRQETGTERYGVRSENGLVLARVPTMRRAKIAPGQICAY